MDIIAPSLLSADFSKLGAELQEMAANGAKYVHIDIMDGHFVPNLAMGIPVVKSLSSCKAGLVFDVHLMIENPILYVERFCDAGADIVTVHTEADTPENIRAALETIRAKGVIPGISVKPGTPAEAVEPYLDLVGLVLVMTVEPGFGGQSFMADMMPKLKAIRRMIDVRGLECDIEVDGGINEKTAQICRKNGANVFVTGSAYFKAADRRAFAAAVLA